MAAHTQGPHQGIPPEQGQVKPRRGFDKLCEAVETPVHDLLAGHPHEKTPQVRRNNFPRLTQRDQRQRKPNTEGGSVPAMECAPTSARVSAAGAERRRPRAQQACSPSCNLSRYFPGPFLP